MMTIDATMEIRARHDDKEDAPSIHSSIRMDIGYGIALAFMDVGDISRSASERRPGLAGGHAAGP
ncbi:hypothetical protein [Slackia exigua]|uniref:hypothetical protein n=1 Tax=Slackia exigua TaxID=84109 RepID=UPI002006823F|nr:hypothetical protein [Slackia exigua]MCK6138807.1 hypothetical protein [Slackia exigua]